MVTTDLKLTREEISAAIDWFKDCQWREEMDESYFDELSDEQVEKGVQKHFCGGIEAFKQSMISVA